VLPVGKLALHPVVEPVVQLIPAGSLVTVPVPSPAMVMVSSWPGSSVNVAVTLLPVSSVTLHPPLPVHAPLQLSNFHPGLGCGVSATVVSGAGGGPPRSNAKPQVPGQEMPEGAEVTVPPPVTETVTVRWGITAVNVAVTEASALIVTVQGVVVHAPVQLPNAEYSSVGAALSVTCVPSGNWELHVPAVQEMPEGAEVTVPLPPPWTVTESVRGTGGSKVAPADAFPSIVSVHSPVPAPPHAPVQPANVELPAGEGVRVTEPPCAKVAVHAPEFPEEHEIPEGEDVIVPLPLPPTVTVSEYPGANVAVTERSALIVTEQVPAPPQSPDQPPKTVLGPGPAVSVTTVPSANGTVHVPEPQETPDGEEVTPPVPETVTLSVWVAPPPPPPPPPPPLQAASAPTIAKPTSRRIRIILPSREAQGTTRSRYANVPLRQGQVGRVGVPPLLAWGEEYDVALHTMDGDQPPVTRLVVWLSETRAAPSPVQAAATLLQRLPWERAFSPVLAALAVLGDVGAHRPAQVAPEAELEQAAESQRAELLPELGPADRAAEALQHDLHRVAERLALRERELLAQPAAHRSLAVLVLVELEPVGRHGAGSQHDALSLAAKPSRRRHRANPAERKTPNATHPSRSDVTVRRWGSRPYTSKTLTALVRDGSLRRTRGRRSSMPVARSVAFLVTAALVAALASGCSKDESNDRTVTFDKNDAAATGSMAPQTIASGDTANLAACGFTKPGWAFMGWATTPGGTVAYADQAPFTMGDASVTLYAQWIITFAVTYDPNGATSGAVPAGAVYRAGDTVTVAHNADGLAREGYDFFAWNTAPDRTGTTYAPGSSFPMPSHDVTLYAYWRAQAPIVLRSFASPGTSKRPEGIAYDGTHVYVGEVDDGKVYKVDPATGLAVSSFSIASSHALALDGAGNVWTTSYWANPPALYRYPLTGGASDASLTLAAEMIYPTALAYDATSSVFWMVNTNSASPSHVWKLDASGAEIEHWDLLSGAPPGATYGLCMDDDPAFLWMTYGNVLAKLSTSTHDVIEYTIPGVDLLQGCARAEPLTFWLVSGNTQTIVKVDVP
jgi:uncharacterized repeat protein (TIGR02543 family)